ncbi:MAG: DNA-processing protein DprA [Gammaproteobacteria bacterium]|nr:DNA-processing protein DprA [Gammaproteobacteria bacterium]
MDDNHPPQLVEDLRDWLRLIRAPGLGSRTLGQLLQRYRTPGAIISAAAGQLPDPRIRQRLACVSERRIAADLAWLEQPHHHLICLHHARYPALLREIDAPPIALFVKGDPEWLGQPQLAVVGSRNPTPGGEVDAHDFARALSNAGITITSGLAAGIDGAAHRGALAGTAKSVAVTATGVDLCYPRQHRQLATTIAAEGALVSEFPPETPPRRGHFPRRNRIISGLSLGTLVVEAARDSGSLITARCAAEQGRELFAIPGSIHNPLAKGCHRLIRQGAALVECVDDILELLGPLISSRLLPRIEHPARTPSREWDDDYRCLLEALEPDPQPNDLLIARSGLTADAVSSMLILLELEGYVSSSPGRGYALSRRYRPESAD